MKLAVRCDERPPTLRVNTYSELLLLRDLGLPDPLRDSFGSPKTMTGDYGECGTVAQEFGASFRAGEVAFVTASTSLQTILNRTIAGGTLVARAERYCA